VPAPAGSIDSQASAAQDPIVVLLGVEEAPEETDLEDAQGDISRRDRVGRSVVIGCSNRQRTTNEKKA
jgi:hypothetical protein